MQHAHDRSAQAADYGAVEFGNEDHAVLGLHRGEPLGRLGDSDVVAKLAD
jgi:hypothetical protein